MSCTSWSGDVGSSIGVSFTSLAPTHRTVQKFERVTCGVRLRSKRWLAVAGSGTEHGSCYDRLDIGLVPLDEEHSAIPPTHRPRTRRQLEHPDCASRVRIDEYPGDCRLSEPRESLDPHQVPDHYEVAYCRGRCGGLNTVEGLANPAGRCRISRILELRVTIPRDLPPIEFALLEWQL